MRASLIPLDGGQTIEINKDITVVGRKEFCDVQLEDASVSKVHLLLIQTDGVLIFRDMGSTNGTKVNGQRVIRGVLMPNDKLNIAACKYQVQLIPDAVSTENEAAHSTPAAPGSSPVIRVYKAEEMALRAASPNPDVRRDTPEGGILVKTDEQDRAASPSGSRPPSAAPRMYEDRPANAAPEFVD